MKLRPVHFVWLLLFAATLAMGAVAFWLLGREARRVETLARETLANRTAAAADNLDFLVSEIRSGIGDSLYALAESGNQRSAMARLVASNPFVAAGFQMREKDRVTLWFGERGDRPDPSQFLTPEVLSQEIGPMDARESVVTASGPTPQKAEDLRSSAPTDQLEEIAFRGSSFRSDSFSSGTESEMQSNVAPADEETYRAKSALKQQIAVVRELNVANRREILEDRQAAPFSEAATSESVQIGPMQERSPGSLSSADESSIESLSEVLAVSFMPAEQDGEEIVSDEMNEDSLVGGILDESIDVSLKETYPKKTASRSRVSDEERAMHGDPAWEWTTQIDEILEPIYKEMSEVSPVSGWLTVPVEGKDIQLGWIRLPRENLVFGAWLDERSLEAELAKAVFLNEREGLRLSLARPDGTMVSDDPTYELAIGSSLNGSSVEMPVGPSLAGWRLRAFEPDANPFGRSFRLLGAVVVSGLGLAILFSGSLLLRQSRKDALEAQRKTTFVANVSHELKTPLTSIRMFAEMLQEGRVSDPAKRDGYLERISAETQRLGRLVNNVLSFSRLDRRKHEFNLVRRDLVEELREFGEMQTSRLQEAGMVLEVDTPPDPVWVGVDPDALGQILLNLLDNALKYAHEGEKVRLEIERQGEAVELRVRDFGPGIPSREKRRVFEAFHRVDDRLTAERAGCGLGLSIGKRLADGMGMELRLVDNRPSGCCFILRWPRNGEESE